MATWQESNGGGLLAGIGRQNINAPQASDINTTLGLIRDNNDIARSGANNVALTGLRGLAGVADIYNQQQQQEAQNAFNQAQANAWKTGDTSLLRDFAAANPAFVAQAQQAFSGLKEQQRNDLGDLAMRANVALSQGPEVYSKFVSDNKSSLQAVGANPDWMIQTGVQNPDQLSHMLTTMSMGALGPEKAFDVMDKQEGRRLEQGRLDESIRSNQASEANTIRGQNLTYQSAMTGHSIAQQNVNLRRMELDDKKYDRQIARETNDLKLADLQDKRAKNQQDIEQARRDKADAYNTSMDAMSRTVETAQKVLDSPGFNGYFGVNLNPLSNRFIPGTDAADTSALVDTLKSQGFMSGIQQMRGLGALSNVEGQKVMDAIGNLSASQSEASAKASIKAIISTTQKAQERLQQKYGNDIPPIQNVQQSPAAPTQQANSGYQSLWGD
ncbi:phage DNA ejection protein [Serratia marcescens]|uniref:phage DNA ejection protein n=1 Tax=Serratia marcescens TaxID=615 RepID=UPI0014957666|nr:phage DNA ejection protein [Serratia marcescens]